MSTSLHQSNIYIYIYIYIERERERDSKDDRVRAIYLGFTNWIIRKILIFPEYPVSKTYCWLYYFQFALLSVSSTFSFSLAASVVVSSFGLTSQRQ